MRALAVLVLVGLVALLSRPSHAGSPAVWHCAAFDVPGGVSAMAMMGGDSAGQAMVPAAAALPQGWTPQGGASVGGKPVVIACSTSAP